MNINSNYKYTKSHEWVEILSGGKYKVGITDYAQHALGDIVFVDLPSDGDTVERGKSFANAESVKAVSDLFSPVSGTICAVNDAVGNTPGLLNTEPYTSWIITVADVTETEELLSAVEYEGFCKTIS